MIRWKPGSISHSHGWLTEGLGGDGGGRLDGLRRGGLRVRLDPVVCLHLGQARCRLGLVRLLLHWLGGRAPGLSLGRHSRPLARSAPLSLCLFFLLLYREFASINTKIS